jgi:hypothetical protein
LRFTSSALSIILIVFLQTGERFGKPIFYGVGRPAESAASSDYTRGAPVNQLDDGIGDTLVLGSVE